MTAMSTARKVTKVAWLRRQVEGAGGNMKALIRAYEVFHSAFTECAWVTRSDEHF